MDSEFSRIVSAATHQVSYAISGTVTYKDRGLAGVGLPLSDNGPAVSTDAHGYYRAEVEPGWSGTVTPGKGYYQFMPAVRTYASVFSEHINQDFIAIIPLTLTMQAERRTERAFIISRDWAKLTVTVGQNGEIPGLRFVIERKVEDGAFQVLIEFVGSDLVNGTYMYHDTFLDKDKSYTYRLILKMITLFALERKKGESALYKMIKKKISLSIINDKWKLGRILI